MLPGGCGQGRRHRPRHHDAVLPEPSEEPLHRIMVPERDVLAAVEPRRVARQPGFGKDDELCAGGGGLADQAAGLLEGRREVQERGGGWTAAALRIMARG